MDTGNYMANQMDDLITAGIMQHEIQDGNICIDKFMGTTVDVTVTKNEWQKGNVMIEGNAENYSGYIKSSFRHAKESDDIEFIKQEISKEVWDKIGIQSKYNSLWDAIVPVAQKITALNLPSNSKGTFLMAAIFRSGSMFNLKDLWDACIDFILWYNKENEIDTTDWVNGLPPNF